MSSIAQIDRELLLAHVLGKPREWVLVHPAAKLRPSQHRRLAGLLHLRACGEPLAYLLGEQWFYGRPFTVNQDVLIPRPETELLVELALTHIRTYRIPDTEYQILDLGTGSGCIAVTLAAELPKSHIIAVDSSPDAIRVARTNARRHGVAGRITFLRGNLLSQIRSEDPQREEVSTLRGGVRPSEHGVPIAIGTSEGGLRAQPERWDGKRPRTGGTPTSAADLRLITLANLPYLTTAEWRALPRSIRAYEPREALDGGLDGLRYYRGLLAQLAELRTRDISVSALLEIDPRRKRALTAIMRRTLPGWEASWHRDLSGRYRVLDITAQRKGSQQ